MTAAAASTASNVAMNVIICCCVLSVCFPDSSLLPRRPGGVDWPSVTSFGLGSCDKSPDRSSNTQTPSASLPTPKRSTVPASRRHRWRTSTEGPPPVLLSLVSLLLLSCVRACFNPRWVAFSCYLFLIFLGCTRAAPCSAA